MNIDYIRAHYGVPAALDGRVIAIGKPGRIVGTDGPHLLILTDGDTEPGKYHPTWKVEYLADAAKVDELTAERDAARDMANTARHETAQALHTLDKARAVVEAAKTWRDWYAASPVRMQHLSDAEEALFAAVDALPTANTDDQPCCGYRCQDNTTGVTA